MSTADVELLQTLQHFHLRLVNLQSLWKLIGYGPRYLFLLLLANLLLYVDRYRLLWLNLSTLRSDKRLHRRNVQFVTIFIFLERRVHSGDRLIDKDFFLRTDVAEEHVLRQRLDVAWSSHCSRHGVGPYLHRGLATINQHYVHEFMQQCFFRLLRSQFGS